VAELADTCFWYWRAAVDEHGTTMNRVARRRPKDHEKYFHDPGARNSAQWTRVMTLPSAVGMSR